AGGPARGDARAPGAGGASTEVRLHRAELPEPRGRLDVAPATEAAGRGGKRARAPGARRQPVRATSLRGRASAAALLPRWRGLRHVPRDLLEDPVAGDPAWL